MKLNYITICLPLMLSACSGNNNKSDAYGNFEAIEVIVSAEAQGKVEMLNVAEGAAITKEQVVGSIDSVSLFLKKQQIKAQVESAQARMSQIQAQVNVQEEQKKSALREQERLKKLVAGNAAPSKQFDDISSQVDITTRQIESTNTQRVSLSADIRALQSQLAQMDDMLSKATIHNPINGTVLEKYLEVGEMAVAGKAIYKIADLSVLKLRVYVSGAQLPQIKLGQKVKVFIDDNANTNRELSGTVSWIAQQAEFTPKIIQTKEERVNLVYAVKIDVPNDGSLKIGMPGEVNFQ